MTTNRLSRLLARLVTVLIPTLLVVASAAAPSKTDQAAATKGMVKRSDLEIVDCLLHPFIKKLAGFEGAAQCFSQVVERVVEVLEILIGVLKAGVEQVVGELLHQIFEIDIVSQLPGIPRVANALHPCSSRCLTMLKMLS